MERTRQLEREKLPEHSRERDRERERDRSGTGGIETGRGTGSGNEAGRGTAETPSATVGAGAGAHLCGTGVGAASREDTRESCRHGPPCPRVGSRPQRDRHNLHHPGTRVVSHHLPSAESGCHLSPNTTWSSGHLPTPYPHLHNGLLDSALSSHFQ